VIAKRTRSYLKDRCICLCDCVWEIFSTGLSNSNENNQKRFTYFIKRFLLKKVKIWPKLVKKLSKFGQGLVKVCSKFGQSLVKVWSKFANGSMGKCTNMGMEGVKNLANISNVFLDGSKVYQVLSDRHLGIVN
jgi:hypothetical protein